MPPPIIDVRLRAEEPADQCAVRAVHTAAFGDPVVGALADALRTGNAAAGPGLVAACTQGRIVGHVGLSRGWVDARPRLVEVLVLSPLGVRPDWQGRGVGARLVVAAQEAAAERGSPLLFLEGSPRYYRRFGFVGGADHGFERPSVRIPAEAFQVFLLPGWQPWMTGALVYNDAFWQFDRVGLRPR